MRRSLLYACFVASGAAGLILEIVWFKYLSLLLGNSIHGVATVVAAFLGGLGLGAHWGGRLAARASEPLVFYARLEAGIGLLGLLSPLAYLAGQPLIGALYAALGGGSAPFLVLRFVVLFMVLLPPTMAMGATLPLLASDFTRRGMVFSSSVGWLYAFNTAGAVLGVAAAGFMLVPLLGLWRTAVLAACLDFGVALVILLFRPAPPGPFVAAPAGAVPDGIPAAAGTPAAGAASARTPLGRLIIPLFAISGFTAILYEVTWSRILSVPLGGMVYAFSAILAIYLLGLSVGAAGAARILRAVPRPVLLFGVFQIALAALVSVGAHLFGRIPGWQASLIIASHDSTARLFAGEVALVALVVLPPTLLLGALFPVAASIYQRSRQEPGAAVGAIYAANTVGSIAGALLTGFTLIPVLGALRSLLVASAINAGIGLLALLRSEAAPARRRAAAALAAAGAIAYGLFALPDWPAQRMSLGFTRLLRAYRFGGEAKGEQVVRDLIQTSGTVEGSEQLRFYREGRLASVAVIESTNRMALIVNGKPDASTGTGEDMMTQVMVGQLPLLLYPRAQDVCIIGYGSGVTTHSVLTHPVRTALTLEIEPAVIEAAPFFRDGAHDPLSDPRSRLLIEDAGTYLRATADRFDVIVSEPSNPWIAGVGDLFTREFYKKAAARLRPGGLFCQWLQCYEISPATMNTVLRTLGTQFASGQIFFFRPTNDLVILASPDREVVLDPETMAAAFNRPDVARDIGRVGIVSVADLLRNYRGRLERAVRAAGPGPINTDDNGWLEHRAPLDLVRPPVRGEPLGWSNEVALDLAASLGADRARAEEMLLQAVDRAIADSDPGAAHGFAVALEKLESPEARAVWPRVHALEQRVEAIQRAQGILTDTLPLLARAAETGDENLGRQAAAMLAQAAQLDPANGEIARRYGTALIAARRPEEAVRELRRALGLLAPGRHFSVRRDLVVANYFSRNLDEAVRELEILESLRPGSVDGRYWRARIRAERGETARALEEIEQGLRDHPGAKKLEALRRDLTR